MAFLILSVLVLFPFSAWSPVHAKNPTKDWAYILPESLNAEASERLGSFRTLGIVGFRLEEDGTLRNVRLPSIPASILARWIVYPVLSFRSRDGGARLLRSDDSRARAISSLTRLAGTSPFSGVHLDFEDLRAEDAGLLAHFLSELHRPLRDQGSSLTLAIFPPNFPSPGVGAHDLRLIGSLADGFVLMTYDLHRPSTEPGPVTDLRWAAEGIRLSREHVIPEKLWLGIPAYGYEWTLPSGQFRTLTRALFLQRLWAHGANIHRDPSGCLFIGQRIGPGKESRAWFPDQEMRRQLQDLAASNGLAGTALWRPEFDRVNPEKKGRIRGR